MPAEMPLPSPVTATPPAAGPPSGDDVLASRARWLVLVEPVVLVNLPASMLGGPVVSAVYSGAVLVLVLAWLAWARRGLRAVASSRRLLEPGYRRREPFQAAALAGACFGLLVVVTTPLWVSLGQVPAIAVPVAGAVVVLLTDAVVGGLEFRFTAWRDWVGLLTTMPFAIPLVVQTAIVASCVRAMRRPGGARPWRRVLAAVLLVSDVGAVATFCWLVVTGLLDGSEPEEPVTPTGIEAGIEAALGQATVSPSPFDIDLSFEPVVLHETGAAGLDLEPGTCLELDTFSPDWDVAQWDGGPATAGDLCLGPDGLVLTGGVVVEDEPAHDTCVSRLSTSLTPAEPVAAEAGVRLCAWAGEGAPAAVSVTAVDGTTGTVRVQLTVWAHG